MNEYIIRIQFPTNGLTSGDVFNIVEAIDIDSNLGWNEFKVTDNVFENFYSGNIEKDIKQFCKDIVLIIANQVDKFVPVSFFIWAKFPISSFNINEKLELEATGG